MRRVLKRRVKRSVLVTTKTQDAFRGVLWDWDRDACVLRNAEQMTNATADRPFVPVDGELVILVADVAYVQCL